MNEAALPNNNMYDQVPEINQLNRVEGFDPRNFMRLIEGDTYYLDVVFRKLWFRLKYPQGKIVKKILKLTESVAIVEARVYLDRNDPEDNYISNALAQRYLTDNDKFGNKYVELAETAAVGRALSDAGFGLQFADREKDYDPEVTEAPINAKVMQGESMIPGQCGIEEYIPMPEEIGQSLYQSEPPASQQPKSVPVKQITKDMPVEEIYNLLNRDEAAKVVISIGVHKGKTLGQLSVEKPHALEWYVNSYAGPDNLLRAAAKFLMNAALEKSS